MEIYIVQQGDTIFSIADRFGISADKLVHDNGMESPFRLVIGQTIVIAYPAQTHVVMEGDTLMSIADTYQVSSMQILRNNSYLSEREFLYPGETLTISYNTNKSIKVNGFTYPFIKKDTLLRTLPSLTYLSIFNYSITEKGEIVEYQDETELIKTAVDYGVIPLMLLTTLTPQGVSNVELAYSILLSEIYQERNINLVIDIIRRKGYQGVNLVFNYVSLENQVLYVNFVQKISERLKKEGLLFFVSINYTVPQSDDKITTAQIDYSAFSSYIDGLMFLRFIWGTDYGPPAPVTNIHHINILIDYVSSQISPDKIIIGNPTIGYDWQLPYIPNRTSAVSISLRSVLDLAFEVGTTIQFDEESQTPYFNYNQFSIGYPFQHIVWFIDARSINSINNVIGENHLAGNGVWNIMVYYAPLWTLINATFDTIKLI